MWCWARDHVVCRSQRAAGHRSGLGVAVSARPEDCGNLNLLGLQAQPATVVASCAVPAFAPPRQLGGGAAEGGISKQKGLSHCYFAEKFLSCVAS